MKQSWEVKKFSDVCEIMNGGTPDTAVLKYWDGDNLWITPKDMGKLDGIYVDNTLRKITNEGLKNSSAKILPINSIILSSRAPIGHLAINTKPISTNQGCKGLVPKKGIETLYVYYFLSKSVDLLNSLGSGTTFKELSGTKLGTVEIPIPPLPEQQRIVAILDEAFEAIAKAKANAERNLQNAKELFQSELNSIFTNKGPGWEEKKLGEVCELKSGTTISPLLERTQGDVLYTKVGDMNLPENQIEINNSSRFVNSYEININQIIPEGAIIFPKRGGAIATNKKRKIIKPTIVDLNTMAIIPGKNIDKEYFYHWFQLINLNDLSNGSSIPQINNYSFDDVYIAYPISIQDQKVIVDKLDTLSLETKKLEEIYQNKLVDLEELKKSILNKAFEGEL